MIAVRTGRDSNYGRNRSGQKVRAVALATVLFGVVAAGAVAAYMASSDGDSASSRQSEQMNRQSKDAVDSSGNGQPQQSLAGPGTNDVFPGPDCWMTEQPTFVTFGTGGIPSIPPGLLSATGGFSGAVPLEGLPLDPFGLGDTDTIVQRLGTAVLPADGSSDTIPVEIVELSLRSIDPIDVGGSLWDVYVGVDLSAASTGTMTITRDDATGGTFTSSIDVLSRISFRPAGGGPEVLLPGVPTLTLTSGGATPTPWGYVLPPGVLRACGGPNFYPLGPVEEIHPAGAMHSAVPSPPPGGGPPEDRWAEWIGPPFPHAVVDFSPGSPLPPIPPGFFGNSPAGFPSLPLANPAIELQGEPIDLLLHGNAHTIVRRPQDPVLPPDPIGAAGSVPIEIVELKLVSTAPITVDYQDGTQDQWRVEVELSPTPVPVPGQMTGQKTHPNGGVFESVINFYPLIRFTQLDPPFGVVEMDTGDLGALQTIESNPISNGGTAFVHVLSPNLDLLTAENSQFVPGVEENPPGNPLNQQVVPLTEQTNPFPPGIIHIVCPPPPPPPPDPHATWLEDGVPGSGTGVDFGGTGGAVPVIPPDFFEPGSDPFSGSVELRGTVNSLPNDNTSVVLQRDADPVSPADPDGTSRTVEIEIVQLSLVSIEPITVTYGAGGPLPELWDVSVDLSIDRRQSPGSLSATKTHANGGTYDVTFPVLPRLCFTRVQDGVIKCLDYGLEGIPDLVLSAVGGSFVFNVDASLNILTSPGAAIVFGVKEDPPGATQVPDPFTPSTGGGGVTHSVCPPIPDEMACIYNVTCAEGDCSLCPLMVGEECRYVNCVGGACPGDFSTECGPNCCVTYELVTCRPPGTERDCVVGPAACVCQPAVGKCCLPDGTCAQLDALSCAAQMGLYAGDGTMCDPATFVPCCLPNGTCADLDPVCCLNAGGALAPGPCAGDNDGDGRDDVCATPPVGACCAINVATAVGGCIITNSSTCAAIGGSYQGDGSVCNAPQPCCLPDGSCRDLDPVCCQDANGVTTSFCANSDSNPMNGVDDACEPVVGACCEPNGPCILTTSAGCAAISGTYQGDGTACNSAVACCTAAGCQNLDPVCCGALNPPGTSTLNSCAFVDRPCCLPDGSCSMLDPECCLAQDGVVSLNPCAGTDTNPINGVDDACEPVVGGCCEPQGGPCLLTTSAGCATLGGSYRGDGTPCNPDQACCSALGCSDVDPVCCTGTVGTGICTGQDVSPPNGIDDACDTGTPPVVVNPIGYPFEVAKNRYLTVAPGSSPLAFATPYAIQVEHPLSGAKWYISTPRTSPPAIVGLGLCYLVSDAAPVLFDFSAVPVIHIGGCMVATGDAANTGGLGHTYLLRTTYDGIVFSAPTVAMTAPRPADGRWWSDIVGVFSVAGNGATTPPTPPNSWEPFNGVVNGFDVTAVLRGFSGTQQPPATWSDIHPEIPDRVTNGNDVLRSVNAFRIGSGLEFYPYDVPQGPGDQGQVTCSSPPLSGALAP